MAAFSPIETAAARALLSAAAVRHRAEAVHDRVAAGGAFGWRLEAGRLPAVADRVAAVTRAAYPTLEVPFHARWRHFVHGGRDLGLGVLNRIAKRMARARASYDLVIVAVLLDAGAGGQWRYRDAATGVEAARSEGLGLAALRMFEAGAFSAMPGDPLRADAAALKAMTPEKLAAGFQVTEDNPLVGLEGRAALLASLGRALEADPAFATDTGPRPGGLFDRLADAAGLGEEADPWIGASALLETVLHHLGPVWPSRLSLGGVALGDCWRLPGLGDGTTGADLVPLHKLSQWLTYSLIEPTAAGGVAVADIDALTGLAEYRNGGLFVDAGVLQPADAAVLDRVHQVDEPLIVAWRALTVALLDRLAPLVRERLGVAADSFPLAKVLEGGTWAAGRQIARELRQDGTPPLKIASDGTVF